MVFVKTSTSAGGHGVEPVQTKALATFLEGRGGLKPGELIQEGVDGLALHDGKKFVIRCYFIVYGGALYVSHNAVAVVHANAFDGSDTTREVHVDHKLAGTIIHDLQAVTGKEASATWIAAIIVAAKLAGPMFERVVAESAKDNLLYHVFGVDALPKTDGSVMFIECNISPNMVHPEGAMVANNRMVRSVFRLLFGVLKGEGFVDDEMTKVWTLPLSSL
jgi:hypothetical protein